MDIGNISGSSSALNYAEEVALAWALAAAAAVYLRPDARAWLCAKIGAGEHVDAIKDVIGLLADSEAELPSELASPLQAWIRGYVGSDIEPELRSLTSRIRFAITTQGTGCPVADRHRLIAKRSEHAARRR
ncbi:MULTISPECIES: hypothetical protein [unclassified Mycobacterium]|uniref:hypothetical protein n=1 Tax=unclassified Mycobacterium TaxID=2642494 RepID=UPI0029C61599|nr:MULTISPECIES: hypothetical protein [unclassified Mycobacterium]